MIPHVAGYRGTIRDVPALLRRARGMTLLRADRVYGADHLHHAAALAARAYAEGRARTADVATETMLYAAGERQIGKALERMGIHADTRTLALVTFDADADADALAHEQGWTRDDNVLEGDTDVLDAFGITPEERAMLPPQRWGDLVLERVALTDVLKN